MTLNSEIANALENGDLNYPPEIEDAAEIVMTTIKEWKNQGIHNVSVSSIQLILTQAGLNLDSEQIWSLFGYLINRGVLLVTPQVIDGKHRILIEGEDYDSLPNLLTGNEYIISLKDGSRIHHNEIHLTFQIADQRRRNFKNMINTSFIKDITVNKFLLSYFILTTLCGIYFVVRYILL